MRKSDLTGYLYAFCKIDSSVISSNYYPPLTVLSAETIEEKDEIDATWRQSVGDNIYNKWKSYHDSIVDNYPEDCYIPTHYGILVSKDGGITWDVLWRSATLTSSGVQSTPGFRMAGYFRNGECVGGIYSAWAWQNPVVISEGKHKYVNGGCDFDGEIFIRLNSTTTAELM
jgi:hypothetical protein